MTRITVMEFLGGWRISYFQLAKENPRPASYFDACEISRICPTPAKMLPINVALVSEVPDVELPELSRVAAAIQKQVMRDFSPIWDVSASLAAFAEVQEIPLDYWIVTLCYSVPEGSGGHRDVDGRPAGFVEWADNWSHTASHEVLEMLVDPWGKRLIAGPSIKPDQGRVEYLVEVSDPCQSEDCAYNVNGEVVSDFCTPQFFDPFVSPGVRYSYSGKITAPRQVLPGGYLSWREPIGGHWWQARWYTGDAPTFVDCGELLTDASFRAQIDGRTSQVTRGTHKSTNREDLRRASAGAREAAKNRGDRFQKYLASLARQARTN